MPDSDNNSAETLDEKIRLQREQDQQHQQLVAVGKTVPPVGSTAAAIVKSGQQLLPSLPVDRLSEDQQYLFNQRILQEILIKSLSSEQVPDAYDNLNKELRAEDKAALEDQEEFRRAIHSISTAWNSLGVFRSDFNRQNNDRMARNAYIAIVEKAFLDYFTSLEWDVFDRETQDRADRPYDFLDQPNPQESFGDVLGPATRDLFRYDAGAWVKTFNRKTELIELKAYNGPEFWIEMDRVPQIISVPANDNFTGIRGTNYAGDKGSGKEVLMQGWWSRGYAWRYWQRSQTGVYIPYTPSEVCYFARYKRTDNIYGTDYLKFLTYQVQYLIDSTVAAGRTFQNGAVPSMIIEHPNIHAIEQIQQRITQLRVDNAGPRQFANIMHLVNGEQAKTISQHLHDLEWLDGQRFVSQLIWAYFGFAPDEFVGGDSTRATAYVKRNITKSRLLYPMMRYFEGKINREILPWLKGYKKSWQFKFIPELELDDKQKRAQTGAIRMTTIANALQQGIPVRVALKIADDERLNTKDVMELEEARETFMQQQQAMDGMAEGGDMGENGMGDLEQGRYGAGSEGYQPMNFSDYGQGGENTEQRFGNKEEVEYKKATSGYFVGQEFRKAGKRYLVTSISAQGVVKAKVYVSSLDQVPEGRSYKQGERGGYYYLTTLKQQTEQGKKKKKKGGSGGGEDGGSGADEHSAPPPPDIENATLQVKVSGNGVGLTAAIVNGKLKVQKLGNTETEKFVEKVVQCSGGEDPKKFIQCLKAIAARLDLKVSE